MQVLHIDPNGMVLHPGVFLQRFLNQEHGDLTAIRGIIVHQTDSSSAASTLTGYKTSKSAAHFLIDKDGTVYQTASIRKRVNHVGALIARCVQEHRCAPGEEAQINKMGVMARHHHELDKSVPNRYPFNTDSLGIELVGKALDPPPGQKYKVYETVTEQQNHNLAWLVGELCQTLKVSMTEVFRHPVVSQKTPTEAATARW